MARFDMPQAELEVYRPDVREPADFDEFWADTLAQARAHDALIEHAPGPIQMAGVTVTPSRLGTPGPRAPKVRCRALLRLWVTAVAEGSRSNARCGLRQVSRTCTSIPAVKAARGGAAGPQRTRWALRPRHLVS